MHRIAVIVAVFCAAVIGIVAGPADYVLASASAATCPDVAVVVVPGSSETNPNADPHVPVGMLRNAVEPLKKAARPRRVSGIYVPYPADIIGDTSGALGYNFSRRKGVENAANAIQTQSHNCPKTRYLITGFSQGAQVAGDLGAAIGNGKTPIPAEQILGVALLSDPGQSPQGEPTIGVTGPAVGFAGSREGGFGALTDRVLSVCAPNDLYCNVPTGSLTIRLIGMLGSQLDSADPDGSVRHLLSIAVGTFLAPVTEAVAGFTAMLSQPNFVANLITGGERFLAALVQQSGAAGPILAGLSVVMSSIQGVIAAVQNKAIGQIPALVATAVTTCADISAGLSAAPPAVESAAPGAQWVNAVTAIGALERAGLDDRQAIPDRAEQLFTALGTAADALMAALPVKLFPALGPIYSMFTPQRVLTDLLTYARFLQSDAHNSYDHVPLDSQGHTGVQLVARFMSNQIAQSPRR
ncbi:cutinase family protein [Mycobacterium kansasii]